MSTATRLKLYSVSSKTSCNNKIEIKKERGCARSTYNNIYKRLATTTTVASRADIIYVTVFLLTDKN